MRRIFAHTIALALAAAGAAPAHADDIDAQTPTFFVTAHGGYSVYKSQMVQSNDTSTTIGYGFGVWAGGDRTIGMLLQREQSSFTFELNGSTLDLSWQDVHLRWRYGVLHLGLVASAQSAWIVSAPLDADGDGQRDLGVDAEPFLDVTTQGLGGNLGLRLPLGKRSNVYLDATFVTTSAAQEKALKDSNDALVNDERELAFGARMDLDFGAAVKIIRWLDARGGFKYRTYQLTVAGEAYAELLNTTYIGLQAGWQL